MLMPSVHRLLLKGYYSGFFINCIEDRRLFAAKYKKQIKILYRILENINIRHFFKSLKLSCRHFDNKTWLWGVSVDKPNFSTSILVEILTSQKSYVKRVVYLCLVKWQKHALNISKKSSLSYLASNWEYLISKMYDSHVATVPVLLTILKIL